MLTHRAVTILGDIPRDWERDSLGNLLSEQCAGDWGDDSGESAIRVLRSTNFTSSGELDLDDVAERYFRQTKAKNMGLKEGDLLLERSGGGPTQPVGRIAFVERDMPGYWFSNFVQLLRADPEKVDSEFLGWVLLELNRNGTVERLQHQTTQMRNLDFRDYFRVYLPKPSLVEQQQIARVLRNIRELIRATYAKLEAARKLKKALVQNLFTRGMSGRPSEVFRTKWFEVPSTWKERRLAAVASVEAGFTMGRDLSGNETVEVPYLTVVNVQEGTLALTEIECVTVKRTELEGLLLRPGDILMTEGGDRDKLGRGGIWRGEIEPCVYQNHIFRVRLMADTYLPELFHFFIQSWHVKKYFYAHAKQTNNLCTINSRELKRLPLFEPSKDEQKEMIAILQAADDEIVAVQTEIEKLNQVRRSLLQNLLTGQARVDGAGLS